MIPAPLADLNSFCDQYVEWYGRNFHLDATLDCVTAWGLNFYVSGRHAGSAAFHGLCSGLLFHEIYSGHCHCHGRQKGGPSSAYLGNCACLELYGQSNWSMTCSKPCPRQLVENKSLPCPDARLVHCIENDGKRVGSFYLFLGRCFDTTSQQTALTIVLRVNLSVHPDAAAIFVSLEIHKRHTLPNYFLFTLLLVPPYNTYLIYQQ